MNIQLILGKSGLLLRKYAPEIMLGAGVAMTIASTIMACRETPKVLKIKEANKELYELIEDNKDNAAVYATVEEYRKDYTLARVQGAMKYVKAYGPAIILAFAGYGLIFGSHKVLSGRNAALLAAYKILDAKLKEGQTVMDEVKSPKALKEKAEETSLDRPYCRWFDQESKVWSRDRILNAFHLKTSQNQANDMLNARGHLFLNEVYDLLGLQRTSEGVIVGWVLDGGKGVVDFGIPKEIDGERAINMWIRDHADIPGETMTEINPPYYLVFNPDGIVWDLV